MKEKSIIIGAGTYGQTYAAYLLEAGIDVVGYIDDDLNLKDKKIGGLPILGTFESLEKDSFKQQITNVYCPIGENSIREKFLRKSKELGYETPSFIHRSVEIGPNTHLGMANYILPSSVVMPHTITGNYVMVSMGTTIGHHVIIEKSVFISSGVRVGANLIIRENAYIGIGATIMSGIGELGKNSLIGAGSVIIRKVEPMTTMVGNPGRVLYKNAKVSI